MTAKDRQHRNERDRIVNAACSEGRFPRSRMGHYRALYNKDPEGTRTLLTADEDKGGLAKGLPRSGGEHADAAPTGLTSSEDALLQASRAKMGGDLAAAADIMAAKYKPGGVGEVEEVLSHRGFAESSSTPAVVGPSGVAVNAYGGMSYEGLPVSLAEDGTPRVHTSAGAVTIATLATLGLDLEYERVLYASRSRMGAV